MQLHKNSDFIIRMLEAVTRSLPAEHTENYLLHDVVFIEVLFVQSAAAVSMTGKVQFQLVEFDQRD
jgi:hypothetical protein